MISIDQIKQLRKETGISIVECRKALQGANGDAKLAKEILRKWGKNFVEKKAGRKTGQGIIETYVHSNKKIGVMLELRCESDFVARSKDFQKLAHDLCLQIAAMNPLFLRTDDVPEEFLIGERRIYQEQLRDSGEPKKIILQVVEGKIGKFKEDISLMSQPWIKDETKTIKDLINECIAKLGENILIKRFIRFEI